MTTLRFETVALLVSIVIAPTIAFGQAVITGAVSDSSGTALAGVLVEATSPEIGWRQLRPWGIREAKIPAGTLTKFHEPAVWDHYRAYVLAAIGVVLMQAMLIAGLLIQRKRTQRAERALRRGQSELQASYVRIRDLGGRLLNAQEAERARIARELHDDIGQQLCLLAIDLTSLRSSTPAPAKELIDETSSRADRIIVSVHDLSRRLHPNKVHLIGLVAGLQDLQKTMSQAGIPITFTHGLMPEGLPEDLTLCLFRVAQEALQNAVKHSHARTISMQLSVGPSELALSIVDDGVGFNVDAAWGHGLGLISIRERMDAIGGTFEIHSRPGAGARLEIRVALLDIDARPRLPLAFVQDSPGSATPPADAEKRRALHRFAAGRFPLQLPSRSNSLVPPVLVAVG